MVPARIRELMKAEGEKQKEYYDRSVKPLQPLLVGDDIRYQEGKTWKQGIVTKVDGNGSYTAKNTEGAVYRRNRRHLLQTNEKSEPDIQDVNIASLLDWGYFGLDVTWLKS